MYVGRYMLHVYTSRFSNSIKSLDPDPLHYCEFGSGSGYNIIMLYFRYVPDP
jgi:hypothetical protein